MKKQKQQRANEAMGMVKTVFLSFFALVAAVAIGHFADADEPLLKVNEKTVYAGDCIEIASYFSEQEKVSEVAYELADTSEEKDALTLDADGTVSAVKAGKAQVTVSYTLEESPVNRQETFTVHVINPQEISAVYGEELPAIEAWNYYEQEDYELIFSESSLGQWDEKICVEGLEDATISLKKKDGSHDAFEVAKVDIMAPVFASEKFARAMGTEAFSPEMFYFLQTEADKTYKQDILDAGKIQWEIGDVSLETEKQEDGQAEDASIATVSEKGILALKEGRVKISAILTAMNGDKERITGELIVTNPVLENTQMVLAKGVTKPLVVKGTCEVSIYTRAKTELEASEDLAYISTGLNVYAAAKGTINVSIIVDGKLLTAKIIVTNPKFTSSSAIMYKKQSKTVKLTGLNSTYSTVVFSSSNKKIATVSGKGVVKAKKSGRVRIYATVDGKKIYVLVEVSSKAGYKAAKKAIAISKTKTKYSQWRRMRKGYYDCSSLVSRVYRPYGVYFGVKRGWSPTAASIGKWCARNKKVLSKKAVSYKKLLPGDIICYSYTRNGRYRNISHIEIYVGNGKNVSASSRYNKVVHYGYKKGSTVLVARPKK